MNKKPTKDLYGLGDYNTNQVKSLVQVFEIEKQSPIIVYNRRPDAASDPGKHIRSMNLEEIPHVIPDAFAGNVGIELINNLNIQQLEKIGQESDAYQKQTIKIVLEKALKHNQGSTNLIDIENYINYSPAWQL